MVNYKRRQIENLRALDEARLRTANAEATLKEKSIPISENKERRASKNENRGDIRHQRKEEVYAEKQKVKKAKKERQFLAKQATRITSVVSNIVSSQSSEIKAQRQAQMAALRARKTRYKQIAQGADVQTQSEGRYPNKFNRMLEDRRMNLERKEASRQFNSPRKDFNVRWDALQQLDNERKRLNNAEFNLLKAHDYEMERKATIDFTDTKSPYANILMAPNIWASSNPANKDVIKSNRPHILTPQEEDKINKERAKIKW